MRRETSRERADRRRLSSFPTFSALFDLASRRDPATSSFAKRNEKVRRRGVVLHFGGDFLREASAAAERLTRREITLAPDGGRIIA